jgi:chorismate mutase/prephenate dehydratase
MSASISLQNNVSVAYLGPKGSFTHQAALRRFGNSVSLVPQDTIQNVFGAVGSGHVTYGVAPSENSTVGMVSVTMDQFVQHSKSVRIHAETYEDISPCILSNYEPKGIKRIYSMPVAFSQCQNWLSVHLAGVEQVATSSTSRAAQLAAVEKGAAALAGSLCADVYGLSVVAENVQDHADNTTRFFILSRTSASMPPATENDKTMIMFSVDHRRPGALCDVLKCFKTHSLNLTSIDSRPNINKKWHYWFFVELQGHAATTSVQQAVIELGEYCLEVNVLGSWPDQRT